MFTSLSPKENRGSHATSSLPLSARESHADAFYRGCKSTQKKHYYYAVGNPTAGNNVLRLTQPRRPYVLRLNHMHLDINKCRTLVTRKRNMPHTINRMPYTGHLQETSFFVVTIVLIDADTGHAHLQKKNKLFVIMDARTRAT